MKQIAIIGSGVSGSVAARLLANRFDITLFETSDRPGGHANTVNVEMDDATHAVDVGFMVFNERTYPNFCRLLKLLGVQSRESDMSFSVRCSRTGLEYQGSSLGGLFAQPFNAMRPAFLKMISDIIRFKRLGMNAAASGELKDGRTVGDFLESCRMSSRFFQHYLVPMASSIWSSNPSDILGFPAEFMIGFFANHGLLQLRDRPQWRTVCDGSRSYIDALLAPIRDRIRLKTPVQSVTRAPEGVMVHPAHGAPEWFDQVVFATHADQTLQILNDPSPNEVSILSAFRYQPNRAVVHGDTRQLPKHRRAWASWNYHVADRESQSASVTYDLSRLQGHQSSSRILLTLNPFDEIDPSRIHRRFQFGHPLFSRESIVAQQRFDEINGQRRTHFCGAYWGYGFHEDGVNSALAVTRPFGIDLDSCTVASTKAPLRTIAASL